MIAINICPFGCGAAAAAFGGAAAANSLGPRYFVGADHVFHTQPNGKTLLSFGPVLKHGPQETGIFGAALTGGPPSFVGAASVGMCAATKTTGDAALGSSFGAAAANSLGPAFVGTASVGMGAATETTGNAVLGSSFGAAAANSLGPAFVGAPPNFPSAGVSPHTYGAAGGAFVSGTYAGAEATYAGRAASSAIGAASTAGTPNAGAADPVGPPSGGGGKPVLPSCGHQPRPDNRLIIIINILIRMIKHYCH